MGATWIIIISDFLSDRPYARSLGLLASQESKVGGIQILNREETRVRRRGYIVFIDPETGNITRRLVGYRATKEFRQTVSDFLRETKDTFRTCKADFVQFTTETDFEEILIQFILSRKESS
jgi:hypothetical protein